MDIKINYHGKFAKGISLTLANKYSVSIQFGAGNYSTNRNADFNSETNEANTAETAIISPDGEFVEYKGDCVQGYQDVSDIIETLNHASKL